MMNGGNPIMFSRGIQLTHNNGKINQKKYISMYDGDKSAMILNNNNKIYYIEAKDDDIQQLFNQKPSKQNIETKLKLLMNKPKKRKKRRKKRTKKIRFNIPNKKKKIHYTVRKRRSPSKSKSKKSRSKKQSPSKSKSKKKSPSKKTTIQKILPEKLLKTII
jgi:hypothetical protein